MTPSEVLGAARRRPADARGRRVRRRARATRGAGCGSSSTRPGPGPRSSTAGCAPTSPGRPAQGEETLAGRRGGAARDRRRRRAGHDRPRRQGPGVPDRRAVRHDARSPATGARRAAAVEPDDGYEVKLGRGVQTDDFDSAQPARRADGRPTSASGCSTSRRPVRATTSSCRCTASRTNGTPTNAETARRGRGGRHQVRRTFRRLDRVDVPPTAPAVDSAPPQWQAWLDHRPVGHDVESHPGGGERLRSGGHRARRGPRAVRGGRRPRQGPARRRAAAVVEGPLRIRDRPSRARSAADRSTWPPARGSTRRSPPSASPRV